MKSLSTHLTGLGFGLGPWAVLGNWWTAESRCPYEGGVLAVALGVSVVGAAFWMARRGEMVDGSPGSAAERSTAPLPSDADIAARYRMMVDHMSEVLGVYDAAGRATFFSPSVEQVFGYAPDELVGRPNSELVHPEDWPALAAKFDALRSGRNSVVHRYRTIHKSGNVRWTETTSRGVFDPRTGELREFIALSRDITERKHVEQSLKTHSLILEHMAEGVSLTDDAGYIVYTNPALDRMFGYAPGELVGKHSRCLNARQSDEDDRFVQGVVAAVRGAGGWAGEFHNRRRDGGVFHTRARITAMEHNGRTYWVSLQEDVTERKQHERQRWQSERRYRSLIDALASVVWTTDNRGHLIAPSESWRRYTGQSWAEQSSLGWLAAVHEEDRPAFREAWLAAVEQCQPFHREARVWHAASNQHRCCVARAQPVCDPDGNVCEWVATLTDVADRLRAEDAARQHEAQLAHVARLSTMGEMAAGIAHEITQPLGAISNFAAATAAYVDRLTLKESEMVAPVRVWTDRIGEQARRAGEIVSRLRNFARRNEIRRAPTDLNDLLRESVEMVAPEARRRRVQLEVQLAQRPAIAQVDAVQWQQVVVNLLRNALDAVEANPPSDRRVELRTASDGDKALIMVSDNGPGIRESDVPYLFDAFFTTKPMGLGMGLAICRTIVVAHGGSIRVEANRPSGATFRIGLPLCREAIT